MWQRLEPLHAVTYFTPECRQAATDVGLKGFWMGYFACRAAPLGPVGAGVVEAAFANFHPSRVRRAVPDAWSFAAPAAVLDARLTAATAALRRLLPDGAADELAGAVLPILDAAVDAADPLGRPLFAANRDLPAPDDPVAALWRVATCLREHRGDAHVALLAGAGLDGCEVHVLALAGSGGGDAGLYQQARGWSAEEWAAAVDRLAGRGLVAADGAVTAAGRALRADIERHTDELAAGAYAALADDGLDRSMTRLAEAARAIAASGELAFPNPMGLPRSS